MYLLHSVKISILVLLGAVPARAASLASLAPAINSAVTWSVQEGASGGAIDTFGHYVAPTAVGTYHVEATSAGDPSVSGSAEVTVSVVPPTNVIPTERRTVWQPGVPGGIPSRTTLCATVTPEYAAIHGFLGFDTNGGGDAKPAMQYALDNCPAGQVVYLPPGTYRLNQGLIMASGVVLRGAGPDQTKLRLYNPDDWVVGLMPGWPNWGAPKNISADLAKDATQATVDDASGLSVHDLAVIDQLDDVTYLFEGMCPFFKRTPQSGTGYGPSTSATRSVGQIVEITAVDGSTVTFSPALHLPRSAALSPQLWKIPRVLSYAGVEDLYVTGGSSGNFFIQDAAYCWLKNVESDGTVSSNPAPDGTLGHGNGMNGDHVLLQRVFRCTVRDSYFHHATDVIQGGGAYGISFANYSSENLIENNIVYYLNKPLTLRATGGGNVIAYNYIDDAWTSADRGLQETTIDLGHASFPYMELVEGNYAAQIATEDVWGNSGWMTIFRNYATGKQERTDAYEFYQIAALALAAKGRYMNVIGNVLGTNEHVGTFTDAHGDEQYEVTSNPPGPPHAAVFRIGHGVGAGSGTDDIDHYEDPAAAGTTYAQLLRVGNWDNVRNQIDSVPADPIPDSLYLPGRPAFFGPNPWPWVAPADATRINVLPAKQRFDHGTPNAVQ